MKLSETSHKVFCALVSNREAHFESVIRACEDAGIHPGKKAGSYVFNFNMMSIEVVDSAQWVGGDKWSRFAEAVLGRQAVSPSGEPGPSGPIMSPAQ